MTDHALFPAPAPPRAEAPPSAVEEADWTKGMPRWALLGALGVCLTVIGALASELRGATGAEAERVESRDRYQARLGERVAVLETQMSRVVDAVGALSADVRSQSTATTKLTTQTEVLATQNQALTTQLKALTDAINRFGGREQQRRPQP